MAWHSIAYTQYSARSFCLPPLVLGDSLPPSLPPLPCFPHHLSSLHLPRLALLYRFSYPGVPAALCSASYSLICFDQNLEGKNRSGCSYRALAKWSISLFLVLPFFPLSFHSHSPLFVFFFTLLPSAAFSSLSPSLADGAQLRLTCGISFLNSRFALKFHAIAAIPTTTPPMIAVLVFQLAGCEYQPPAGDQTCLG